MSCTLRIFVVHYVFGQRGNFLVREGQKIMVIRTSVTPESTEYVVIAEVTTAALYYLSLTPH